MTDLSKLVDDLSYVYDGAFTRDEVAAVVTESYTLLEGRARVTDFLVVLTRKFARERLSARAASRGIAPAGVPEVLFLCVRNAGRSKA